MYHDTPRNGNFTQTKSPVDFVFENGEKAGYQLPLESNTPYSFNLDVPLMPDQDQDRQSHVTGIITASKNKRPGDETDEFAIIDLRNTPVESGLNSRNEPHVFKTFMGESFPPNVQFLVIGKEFMSDPTRRTGFKAIRRGERVVFGRGEERITDRFSLGDRTSRQHFALSLDPTGENLEIADLGSSNGTKVKTAAQLIPSSSREQQASNQKKPPLLDEMIKIADGVPGYKQPLQPRTSYEFNLSTPLARHSKDGVLTAVIDANKDRREGDDSDQFALIDLRNAMNPSGGGYKEFAGMKVASDIEFLIIGKDFDPQAATGFKGIRRGEGVMIGRSDEKLAKRFNFSNMTSSRHFTLVLDREGKKLIITDLNSTNGTNVKTAQKLASGKIQKESAPIDPELLLLRELIPGTAYSDEVRQEAAKRVEEFNQDNPDKKILLRRIAREMHPDRGGNLIVGTPEYKLKASLYTAAVNLVEARAKRAEAAANR